jgi:NADH-quinone oxidoreductase subunit A
MYLINSEYLNLWLFFVISVLVTLLLLAVAWVLMNKQYKTEKLSSYECGFEPFNDARKAFNVNFYNIGMMFLIFDIELLILLPAAFALNSLTDVGFFWLFWFVTILVLGFFYEWVNSMLEFIK